MEEITKDLFIDYENIRKSGEYNMITDAYHVMNILGIDKETYFNIINNYSELKEKFNIRP